LFDLVFRMNNGKLVRKYLFISLGLIVFVSYAVKMFRVVVFHSVS